MHFITDFPQLESWESCALLLVFPSGSQRGLEPCSSLSPHGCQEHPWGCWMSLAAVVQDIALFLGTEWDSVCKEASLVFIPVEKERFLEGMM